MEANIEESSSARKRKRANHEYTWVRVLVDKCFVHGVSRESWLIMFRINGSSIQVAYFPILTEIRLAFIVK